MVLIAQKVSILFFVYFLIIFCNVVSLNHYFVSACIQWAYGSGMSIDSDGNLEDSSQTASKEALQKPIEYQENSTKY